MGQPAEAQRQAQLPLPWWLRGCARIPLGALYALSASLVFLMRHLMQYRVGVARSNLRGCFPELSAGEIELILNRYYRNLGQVIAECLKQPAFTAQQMARRVRLTNPELPSAEFQAGRSVMLLAGHQGNWEWQLQGVTVGLRVPVDAAYKPLHSAAADRAMLALRSLYGARMAAAKKLLRAVARHRDQVRAIAIMADQIPASSGGRHWLTFFGRDTAFYPGPAEIARSTGYAVFFTSMRRVRRGHYEMTFHPLAAAQERLQAGELTARYAQRLEAEIRLEPANWLWSHRRWKFAPPTPPTPPKLSDSQEQAASR